MSHTHAWIEKYKTSGSTYYECSCGASRLVGNKDGKG